MCAGVCEVTGADEDLTRLMLEKELKWTELLASWEKKAKDRYTAAGATCAKGAAGIGASTVNTEITKSVGSDLITQYTANQAATGLGSGLVKGGHIAIKPGSEYALGNTMMRAAGTGGTATFRSTAGNVVVNVGTKSAVSQGVAAGASVGAGLAGAGAEILAGSFEATKDHKKKIGFAAQVGTAAALGSAGGPIGAAVGAGVGSLSWVAGQVLGHTMEKAIMDSKGVDNPKALAYQNAKARYEAALKEAKSE